MLDALLATWKPVSMIVILAFAVATIFAIMGMSLFKGRFSFCNNPSVIYPMGRTECVGNFFTEQNVMMPSAWDVPAENFDSFTRAMMQCLTMNTMQWADLMRSASDVTEPGTRRCAQPLGFTLSGFRSLGFGVEQFGGLEFRLRSFGSQGLGFWT